MDLNQMLEHWGLDPTWVTDLFERTGRAGVPWMEWFLERSRGTRIVFDGQTVERIYMAQDEGLGIRLFFDGGKVVHYGYVTELQPGPIEALIQTLASTGKKEAGFTSPVWKENQTPVFVDQSIVSRPADQSFEWKLDFVERMAKTGPMECPRVIKARSGWMDSVREICVFNSEGVFSSDTRGSVQVFVELIGEEKNRRESAFASEGGLVSTTYFDQHPPESIARRAVHQLETLLDAVPAPSGSMPVVLSSRAGGTMIHEAVGHGLEADLACHALSVYHMKLGEVVASPLVTVVDDGTLGGRRGSFRFDDEGAQSGRTTLIEKGVLKAYLSDKRSQCLFGIEGTGNGRRESFRHTPMVRMSNTYVLPGPHHPDAILKETSWGLFVASMGGGQVDTTTGDFVFAVTEGYLIRNGTLAESVRGATLVGNGPAVIASIDRLGSDLGFANGTCGKDGQAAPVTDAQPTMRIQSMSVGGEVPLETYFGP
jgi:TldD protein